MNNKRKIRQQHNEKIDMLATNKVTNLSNKTFTVNQLKVLNKGITLVPVSNRINYTAIDAHFKRFERKLQLQFFITNKRSIVHHDNLNTQEELKLNMVPFTKNPNFWPKKLNPHITKFCSNVKDKVLKLLHNKKAHNNLTPGKLRGLRDLRNDNSIVTKKGDKGAGIVIMNTVD